jgi:hypothetical protein
LNEVQKPLTSLERGQDEIRTELQALRNHSLAIQQDIHNIYTILARHETRLNRIERRLELNEAPA